MEVYEAAEGVSQQHVEAHGGRTLSGPYRGALKRNGDLEGEK